MRDAALAIAAALGFGAALTGCGQKVIKPEGAQQSVVDIVSRQTGFHPQDVKCPSGVDAKTGNAFDCHFTGPNSTRYVAHVRITAVQGQRVSFYITARPG